MTTTAFTDAQTAWTQLGYGLFLHFGPNTFTGDDWGDGSFPALDFQPAALDTDQWADLAAEAGMRYAVLTAKHHDGFCLWPSDHTEHSVKHAPGVPDIVERYIESFRNVGIRPGLYYSLWDRHCPVYDDDAAYADYMRRQIGELLTRYGDIVELWFDGGWDKDHPTRDWPYDPTWEETEDPAVLRGSRWEWDALYAAIHEHQSDCLVTCNSSSDRPGGIKYLPVDFRTSEHYDFVGGDTVYRPVTEDTVVGFDGKTHCLPLEYCTTLSPGWFYKDGFPHPSVATITDWICRARATGANLLLNIGPDRRGRLPECHRPFLRDARREAEAANALS